MTIGIPCTLMFYVTIGRAYKNPNKIKERQSLESVFGTRVPKPMFSKTVIRLQIKYDLKLSRYGVKGQLLG